MCSGPDQSSSNSSATEDPSIQASNNMNNLNKLPTDTGDSLSTLLEFAANNDIESFKRSIEVDLSEVDRAGLWYVRKMGMKQITQEERTPLMVASTYGSLDVLKLMVALPEVNLNRSCGRDKWTALHCAAFGGSINAHVVVKLLLSAGADPSIVDASGRFPSDVIVVHPKLLPGGKSAIEDLLANDSSPVLSSSSSSPFSPNYSPKLRDRDRDTSGNPLSEKKQYPIDPSLPDIRNSIYSTDEFRMFSFKIRPCSRAYSHDWTECPFVHPGENARRRDPRKFHYNCIPCPEFRKGTTCRRGDMCEYAHGVFECWLHPAQYRTRLCKDGIGCARQVCFFAHTNEEIRPLYISTGSGIPSPRSASFMDMASALSVFPGSPTSQSMISISPNFNQNMSPRNGIPTSWSQPNVPTLQLPGSNVQSSRLRSSLNARDIPLEAFSQPRPNSIVTPSNLEELFSVEMASSPSAAFSPLHHKSLNTNVFSPRNVEHPLLQGNFCVSPRMSPRSLDHGARFSAVERQQMQIRSMSSPSNKWGPPNGEADWSVVGGGHLNKAASSSSSFQVRNEGEEPDLSWVQSLVKESPPPEISSDGECLDFANSNSNSEIDQSVLGAWLEQMRLDQLVV